MAIAVKILAEAILDRVCLAMVSCAGILLDLVLVDMGVSMRLLLGVSCGG